MDYAVLLFYGNKKQKDHIYIPTAFCYNNIIKSSNTRSLFSV